MLDELTALGGCQLRSVFQFTKQIYKRSWQLGVSQFSICICSLSVVVELSAAVY